MLVLHFKRFKILYRQSNCVYFMYIIFKDRKGKISLCMYISILGWQKKAFFIA